MKTRYNYIKLFLLVLVLGIISCQDMDEVHEQYVADGEIIYTNKVDSLTTFAGKNRVKISGYITGGFNVNEVVVTWNKGLNQQVFPYQKSDEETDPIDLIVTNLDEDNYEFNIYSKDEDGNKSIPVVVFGSAYGENYQSNLEPRAVNKVSFDETNAEIVLALSSELQRDTEFRFTDTNNTENIITVSAEDNQVILKNISLNNPISYRTYYVPTQAVEGEETSIDQFESDWYTYEFPSVFSSIFTSMILEPISGGVIANWENSENDLMTFDFKNMNKQNQEVINTVTSSESTGTYTFEGMKSEEQDVEITISDIYGNSQSMSYTVTPLPAAGKGNWTIVDFSTEEAGGEGPVNGYATAAIDGDPATFWHSNWSSTGSSYPHHLTIDLGEEKSVAGFEVFTRSGDSRGATEHEFWVSNDNVTFTKIATLNAAIDVNSGTLVATDAVTTARYVKYIATAGPENFTFLGELNVITSLDNSDWSIVDFSTEEAGGEGPVNGYATAAIDGDTATFWHSNWSSTGSSYPHHLTIDLGEERSVVGFEIFTRSGFNGGATVHEFWVSNDNITFTQVATLDSGLDPNNGSLVYADALTTAKYVKYVAIEGPNTFTYLGEIRVLGAID